MLHARALAHELRSSDEACHAHQADWQLDNSRLNAQDGGTTGAGPTPNEGKHAQKEDWQNDAGPHSQHTKVKSHFGLPGFEKGVLFFWQRNLWTRSGFQVHLY